LLFYRESFTIATRQTYRNDPEMRKIILYSVLALSLSGIAPAYADWMGDIELCLDNADNASSNCVSSWNTTAPGCLLPGAGGESCVINRYAIPAARTGNCGAAQTIAASCQCDRTNTSSASIAAASPQAVCDYLKNK